MDLTSGAYLKAVRVLDSVVRANPLDSSPFKRQRPLSSSSFTPTTSLTPAAPSATQGRYSTFLLPLFYFCF